MFLLKKKRNETKREKRKEKRIVHLELMYEADTSISSAIVSTMCAEIFTCSLQVNNPLPNKTSEHLKHVKSLHFSLHFSGSAIVTLHF